MNRRKVIECLDQMPRIYRHNHGIYMEDNIEYSFNGNPYDTRTYLVDKGDDWNGWWNDDIDIIVRKNGKIYIEDHTNRFTKEMFLNLMPKEVRAEFYSELDALM